MCRYKDVRSELKKYIQKTFAILSLLFLLMLHIVTASAIGVNDFTFTHLGMEHGLRSQRVYSLCQTDDGAVWCVTKCGVSRYNGVAVKNYSLDKDVVHHNLAGWSSRFVHTDDGRIYVCDISGRIFVYNEMQDRFDVVVNIASLFSHDVLLNDVLKIGDSFWLAMREGVYVFRAGQLTAVKKGVFANCIIKVPDDGFLFGTKQGVMKLGARQLSQHRYQLEKYLPYYVESGYYDTVYKRLWLGTFDRGLVLVDKKGTSVISSLPHNPIRSIVPYDRHTMLVGIDGYGVYQTSRTMVETVPGILFNANEGINRVLHGNGIYALLVDTYGNIVIGSYSGGIDIARPVGSTVAVYQHQRNNMQSLLNDHVNCVMQWSNDHLLMGTDDGISSLVPSTGQWMHRTRGMVVLSLCRTPDNRLLAATYGNGVWEVDANGATRQVYSVSNGTLKDDHVYALLYDRQNHLWMGCLDGPLTEKTPTGYRYYDVDNVQTMALMPDGRIIVGTIRGLKLVTPGDPKVTELVYFSSDRTKVNRYVLDVYIHQNRDIYIATDGGGVYIYNMETRSCRQITKTNGLPSNTVTSITMDKTRRLWLGTDQGLSFIYPSRPEEVINVNYCYGLEREYIRGAAVNLSDGNILFGSISGAVIVNPHRVQKLNYTAKLKFLGAGCSDADSPLFNEQVYKMLREGRLWLGYGQRTFELYFECINLRNQYDIAYQYKLGHNEWSSLTEQQYIRFVNLEPGKHKLMLRAVSKTSRIVLDERQLVITISRPWWNSWWMWCVYISLVLLLFYAAWRFYDLHTRYMRLIVNKINESDGDDHNVPLTGETRHVSTDVAPICPNSNISSATSHGVNKSETDVDTDVNLNSAFVDAVTGILLEHISDADFTIDSLCSEMAMSRTLFYVKLKSYTGKSPQEFIRVVRLERAAMLLRSGRQVGDVAVMVGFDNAKYFSTVFKKYFGTSPSKYK